MTDDRDDDALDILPPTPPGCGPASEILGVGQTPAEDLGSCRPPASLLPAPQPRAAAAEGTFWQSLERRWLAALGVGLTLGCLAAAAAWWIRPAKYTTFAFVKVDSERPELLPRDRAGVNDLDIYRQTQAALLKSPKVLQAALRQDKVRQTAMVKDESDPVGWLDNALTVEPLRNTELLKVTLSGETPEEPALIVNAVVQAYLQEVVNKEQKQRFDRLRDLKDVCESSEEKLRKQRKKLQGVAESLKASDPQTAALRQKIALEEYAALRKELIVLEAELRQAAKERQGDLEATADRSALPEWAVEQALDQDPAVQAQARKVALAQDELDLMKANARPGYSGFVRAEEDLKAANDAMEAVRARLRRRMEDKVRQRADAESRLANARRQDREGLLKRQFEAIQKEVEEMRNTADHIGLAAIVYETERSEIEQAEKIVKSLWTERERLEVEARSSVQRVTVEVEATPPQTKNRKPQLLATAAAGLFFFVAGAACVAYRDCRSRRIFTREQVVHGLGLRVIAALPVQGDDQPGRGRRAVEQGHLWAEAINGLRTVVLYEASQHKLRVVMVTSAGPLEGKTTLASHLALSLAAAGRRTLLVDADMRRPALHRLFNSNSAPGLSEALRGECDLADVIQSTPRPNLWLLPAGIYDDSIPEILAQDRLVGLLDAMRAQHDLVVIDSSPIIPVHDALAIGQHIDAAILSIRPDRSRVPLVHEAYERLQALHIPVLGTVLNGLQAWPAEQRYRYARSVPLTPLGAGLGEDQ